MKLPIRALRDIRAFSRPASRPDWRTCKKEEARMIREYIRTKEMRKIRPIQIVEIVFNADGWNLVPVQQGCGWNLPVKVAQPKWSPGGGGC